MHKLKPIHATLIASAILSAAGTFLYAQQAVPRIRIAPAALPPAPLAASEPASTAPAVGGAAGEPGIAPRPKTSEDPGSPMDTESGGQIYVDQTFGAVEKLRVALRYARQNRGPEALAAFQAITDEFGEKLVYLNNDCYMSITDYVRDQLLKMPAVSDGMYDTLFNAPASHAVDAAIEKRDLADLARVCDRYYPSSAALRGLAQAADWYFERGEFSSAARTWLLVQQHPRITPALKAEFLHHAVLAEKLSGRPDFARVLRDRLAKDFPDATGTIAGESVMLVDHADACLQDKPWDVATAQPGEWPTLGGSPTHDLHIDVSASAGARLWAVDLLGEAIAGEPRKEPRAVDQRMNRMRGMGWNGRMGGVAGEDQQISTLASFPVMSGGALFVHTGERLAALSANAGTPLWVYPLVPISRNDAAAAQMYQNYGQAYRPVELNAASVYENVVFAVLPAAPVSRPPQAMGRFSYMANIPQAQTRVVALNRNDGKELWTSSASSIQLKGGGGLLAYMGTPVVTRQGVFVMARRTGGDAFSQVYLVRLDRQSGEVVWTCYLCSAASFFGYGVPSAPASIAIPTVADDVVYISTGQGADCAVDANAGRILWLDITESAKPKKSNNGMNMGFNPGTMEVIPAWKFNAPLVHHDKLVACETNGNLRVYDRWSGKLLRSTDRKELANLQVLAGFIDGNLITVGDNAIIATDLDKNKKEWETQPPADAGKLAGRPFLAQKILYVPYAKKLLMVDTAKGRVLEITYWPKDEKNQDGVAGNLLVTAEQIVVTSQREITGYSRWETARDNRLNRIKADPTNPDPYLALAEISFRTNHFDLATENMAKAVEHTVGGAVQASDDFRQRIYRTNLTFAEQLLGKSDTAQRDRARFYFEQCKLTAYSPESQAEWRLSMSDLAMAQKKWDEAASLYSALLADSGMRSAPYQKGDALARAGVTAELRLRALIEQAGRAAGGTTPETIEAAGRAAVYKPFESLAAGALAKARTEPNGSRPAAFTSVIESYPNSLAAITAATEVAALQRDSGNWADAIRTLRWLYVRAVGPAKAQATADMAAAQAAIGRWNSALAWADRGARQFGDTPVLVAGKSPTFAAVRESLRAQIPASFAGRWPKFPAPWSLKPGGYPELIMRDKVVEAAGKIYNPPPLTDGLLLAPIEQAPAYRRPDAFFVFRRNTLRMFDASPFKERWVPQGAAQGGIEIEREATVHLGCYGDLAVFVQNAAVIGVDTLSGKLKWPNIPLTMDENDRSRLNELANRIRAQQIQDAQMRGQQMIYDPESDGYSSAAFSPAFMGQDPDVGRNFTFKRTLGQPNFSTMRMIGNKLVVVTGNDLAAYDLATGQPAWKSADGKPLEHVALPAGLPVALLGNDDVALMQVDDERAFSTFRVFDLATGRVRGDIKLGEEHVQWRGLSDDGVLYLVTDRGIAAYDCLSPGPDPKRPLWRREDLKVKFPSATAITIDGLVIVKDDGSRSNLMSLSLEGGETRWPVPPALPLFLSHLPMSPSSSNPAPMAMANVRSFVQWDQIIYQTPFGVEARFTSDGAESWWTVPSGNPPTTGTQMANYYMFSLARDGGSRAMFIGYDRRPGAGKIWIGPLHRDDAGAPRLAPPGNPPMGMGALTAPGLAPNVRQWQVVDNLILLEVLVGPGTGTPQVCAYEAEPPPPDKKP